MKTNRNLIIAINIAALMVLMDLSAINIALPTIRQHFDISVSMVSLILMASMLTATGSALMIGKVIELFRPGQILLFAFVVFGLTTTLTSLTTQFVWIIPLRIIQGVAEAALYVIGPALIKKYIDEKQQQKEYGIWMVSCGLGISLGPLFGGILLKYFSWNAVFLINLPLAILGILFSIKLDKHLEFNKQKSPFDTKGAIYSFLFLAFLIVFFNLFSLFTITHPLLWISAGLSILFLFLFIRQEKLESSPILNLKLFRITNFRLANLGFFIFFFINVGSRFLRPFFFEEARGLSSSTSGVLMMVSPSVMLIVSFFIDKLGKHFTTKQLVNSGNILLSISMLMFSFWSQNTSLLFIVSSMLVLGLAMGVYYPATTQLGMKSLPNGNHGMGSAAISTSKSLGKLMGVLIFALLFQFFFQYLTDQFQLSFAVEAKAVQYVFISAFLFSLIGIAFSTKINKH